MSHYRSNLRDILFNLFEVLDTPGYLGTGPFGEVDPDTARMLLEEVDRFARESIWAESFVATDRTPLELTADGDVVVPEPLHQALQAYYDAGWHLLPLPERLGGYGAPPTVRWAATELFFGGHATAALWPTGALMAWIIDTIGTDEQKRRFVQPILDGRWGATMVLTEPDAGSDVGAATTRARHVEGDVWHLEGVKRFITSADYQGHPNTVHLVLARPERDPPAPPGTKGLSLFIVPKLLVGDDGSLEERNGVRVAKLEDKMGIKGSATCELVLGGDGTPCVGYLAGGVHDGIRQMFTVIEYARMMVGTKAMATLSTGYLNARDYARMRVQGPDMTRMADRTAPKVTIINHPDVRRMLMLQKAHAEGMRALVLYTGWIQDQAALHPDEPEWEQRNDLLLPVVKGFCSERAYELLSLSLQTFGGAGYTREVPIEQYLRDAKIDTLYEGTTGIQALDLFFRKIVRDRGATLTWLTDRIRRTVKGGGEDDPLATERERLGEALEDVQAQIGTMVGALTASRETPEEIYKVGLHATGLLEGVGELVVGWLLLRHAEVAHARLADADGRDRDFYTGKIASARFFARHVLPRAAVRRRRAEEQDGALMGVPEGAF